MADKLQVPINLEDKLQVKRLLDSITERIKSPRIALLPTGATTEVAIDKINEIITFLNKV